MSFDERLEVQERVETTGSDGGVTDTWRTTGFIWAKVEHVKTSEDDAAAGIEGRTTHVVRSRWNGDLKATGRLRRDGSTLDIDAVTHDRRQDRTEARCVEKT